MPTSQWRYWRASTMPGMRGSRRTAFGARSSSPICEALASDRRAMKRILLAATFAAGVLMMARAAPAAEPIKIDLTQWTSPDIATVGEDPFGKLVKYGQALFTDTANEIGPTVSYPKLRFACNNLACKNCHLQAGSQPYAIPLIGVWRQFPQYPAREAAVQMLHDRINASMESSSNV